MKQQMKLMCTGVVHVRRWPPRAPMVEGDAAIHHFLFPLGLFLLTLTSRLTASRAEVCQAAASAPLERSQPAHEASEIHCSISINPTQANYQRDWPVLSFARLETDS